MHDPAAAQVEDIRIGRPHDSGGTGAGQPYRFAARFIGNDRPEHCEFHGDVKAVTYSDVKIEACDCGPGPWVLQVVVDL
jgi:SHS2 domain-containing protein